MGMAHSMDIWASLMDLRVNEEASRVGSLALVAPNYLPGIDIEADQIAGGHEPEVLPERVHPDIVWELGVTNGDVPAHSLREAFPREVSEDGCGVDEDVLAVLGVGRECGDS